MDKELKEMLEETIKVDLENIADMEVGSDDRNKAVNDVAILVQKVTDMDKALLEDARQEEKANTEKRMRIVEIATKIGLGLVELAVPLWWYTKRYHEGMAYEETGSFTSGSTRNLVRSMPFPVKRK